MTISHHFHKEFNNTYYILFVCNIKFNHVYLLYNIKYQKIMSRTRKTVVILLMEQLKTKKINYFLIVK